MHQFFCLAVPFMNGVIVRNIIGISKGKNGNSLSCDGTARASVDRAWPEVRPEMDKGCMCGLNAETGTDPMKGSALPRC